MRGDGVEFVHGQADTTQVMESFDMFLNGNFVAQDAFKARYGVQHENGKTIETKWQSALFQSGQCGAFVGVFLAGPITNRLGYRWTTILGLMLMNATIFISFFVSAPRISSRLKLTIKCRPTHSLFLPLVKHSRACLGVCSLQIPRHMPLRLSPSFFVALARLLCK